MNLVAELEQETEYRWRLKQDDRLRMRTDVVVFASRKLLNQIQSDQSLEQAVNVASLPGIAGPSLAMPDIHQGYGFPIGGVAATRMDDGVVSPGGVGFDINCGVRLLKANLEREEVRGKLKKLIDQLFRDVPCGTGTQGPLDIGDEDLNQILEHGSRWMVKAGYGHPDDAEFSEAGGRLPDADPDAVSPRAKQRGRPQVATLGSGNHFLEVQFVQKILDKTAAAAMGLVENQVVILIHSGSRGLGHQVCTDSLKQMGPEMARHGIDVPDRQLACVPIQSKAGQTYLKAMRAAANYAWANRQGMTHLVRQAFRKVFERDTGIAVIYDVCHNIAKRETHTVDGRQIEVLVHRKGATRAFPAGHAEIPEAYQSIGQPVFVPGSMGTASWILAGQPGAMEQTFGSSCHGAGRLLSRSAAKKGREVKQVIHDLEEKGILVRSESKQGILEEVPEAYKDVDEVIEVVDGAGIARKVARLRPMAVIKG